MCGRFALHAHPDIVALQFGLDAVSSFEPRYNISPGTDVLVVRTAQNRRRAAVERRWGLIPAWAKDPAIGRRLANARGESLDERPAFRDAFRESRCLVPASGYYEWQTVGGLKYPWYLRPLGAELFALAGLCATWQGPQGTLRTVALVTAVPNELAARIHDRMPLIIAPQDYAAWLDPANRDLRMLKAMVRPYSPERMTGHAVSLRVNAPAADDRGLLEPAAEGPRQADLL